MAEEFTINDMVSRLSVTVSTARRLVIESGILPSRTYGLTKAYAETDWSRIEALRPIAIGDNLFRASDVATRTNAGVQGVYQAINELAIPVAHTVGKIQYYDAVHLDAVIARVSNPHQRGPKNMQTSKATALAIHKVWGKASNWARLWDHDLLHADLILRAAEAGIPPDGERMYEKQSYPAWVPENIQRITKLYGFVDFVTCELGCFPDPYDDNTETDDDDQLLHRDVFERRRAEQGFLPRVQIGPFSHLNKPVDAPGDPIADAKLAELDAAIELERKRKVVS